MVADRDKSIFQAACSDFFFLMPNLSLLMHVRLWLEIPGDFDYVLDYFFRCI